MTAEMKDKLMMLHLEILVLILSKPFRVALTMSSERKSKKKHSHSTRPPATAAISRDPLIFLALSDNDEKKQVLIPNHS